MYLAMSVSAKSCSPYLGQMGRWVHTTAALEKALQQVPVKSRSTLMQGKKCLPVVTDWNGLSRANLH